MSKNSFLKEPFLSRFDFYPLDSHICSLRIQTTYDTGSIVFDQAKFTYHDSLKSIVIDFDTEISHLEDSERIIRTEDLGNYSLTGIKLAFTR